MIRQINEKYILTLPALSFISHFSNSFLNRQTQMSYVVQTALFNKDLEIELSTLINNIINITKSDANFRILFIAPDSEL